MKLAILKFLVSLLGILGYGAAILAGLFYNDVFILTIALVGTWGVFEMFTYFLSSRREL